MHELAHIRRADYLVNLVERFVEGLFFYHPAVWWIASVIRAERETCCDDIAVATSGDAHEYAVALAALEQSRWSGRADVAATGGSLMKRIRRVLYPAKPDGAWTPLLAALALTVIAAVSLAAWQAAPARRQSPEATSPYVKWLNEDVVYIINNRERAAFESLTTNEERDEFIEQFWDRRNPTPGAHENEQFWDRRNITPGAHENAFKIEHYRRLAFANQHYSASGTAGWRTDRGHMYILYGPPDEIESHLGTSPAYEMWRYRHVDGLPHEGYFTFIDQTGQGDYRLAPGTDR